MCKVTPIQKITLFLFYSVLIICKSVVLLQIHLKELTVMTSNLHAHVGSHIHVYSATVTRGEDSRRCGCFIIRRRTLVKYA